MGIDRIEYDKIRVRIDYDGIRLIDKETRKIKDLNNIIKDIKKKLE